MSSLPAELLREIRSLHFQTRRFVDQGVMGRYRSAFRGSGMEFEEVREYLPGDEIRRIDWKVTARSGRPFVKSYREERELTVLLAVDISGSTHAGTREQLRASQLARIGAALTLIALKNNDKVGLVTFSDEVHHFHPPRKARSAVWRILHEVLQEREGFRRMTNFAALLRFLQNILKHRAIVFVLSDFIGELPESAIASLARKHEVIAITVRDPADDQLPNAGFIRIEDPESGETVLLDAGDAAVRSEYARLAQSRHAEVERLFQRHRIEQLVVRTDQPFGPRLREYFDRRSRRAVRR